MRDDVDEREREREKKGKDKRRKRSSIANSRSSIVVYIATHCTSQLDSGQRSEPVPAHVNT